MATEPFRDYEGPLKQILAKNNGQMDSYEDRYESETIDEEISEKMSGEGEEDGEETEDVDDDAYDDDEADDADGQNINPAEPASHALTGGSIVSDVLYSIATGEEEGRSRQRILAFAAKRYQNAVSRNPDDYDALYNWALVLQESADNCDPETGRQGKDALLEDACRKYYAATSLCPTLHEAFYNWAIAISDRAKLRGRTVEAEDLWKQACDKYERAVHLNWDSPQALNNWGLALQELSSIVPLREKVAIVRKAITKFRAAIRLRFDFHRAVYNLGTVIYGLAEDTLKASQKDGIASASEENPASQLYAQSAIYIAAAHALKADYSVYRNALRLVRTMLPLPYLKGGYLLYPPGGNALAPHEEWRSLWFALDHESLFQREKPEPRYSMGQSRLSRPSKGSIGGDADLSNLERHPSIAGSEVSLRTPSGTEDKPLRVEMETVLSVRPCGDLTLPPGGGMVLDTTDGPIYLVAPSWEVLDGWVDAIRLVYTIHVRGKADSLAGVLAG